MTVEEAREKGVCRICEKPLQVGGRGFPKGYATEFGRLVFPVKVTFNFGAEFAHTDCLERTQNNDNESR